MTEGTLGVWMFKADIHCLWFAVVIWAVFVHNYSIVAVVVEGCIDPFSSSSLDSLCGEVTVYVAFLKLGVTGAARFLTRQYETQGTRKESDTHIDWK